AEAEASKTAKLVDRSKAKISQPILARETPPPPVPMPMTTPVRSMSRLDYSEARREAREAMEHYIATLPMDFGDD
ncbi:hypothetical protein DFQ26_008892, partial [Actinomortierella ambigua]